MIRLMLSTVIVLMVTHLPSSAQEGISACQSQQELEQVIGSGGQITPDGCRTASISTLESSGRKLCLIDLSSDNQGIVGQLREVAAAEQWWFPCEELEAAISR